MENYKPFIIKGFVSLIGSQTVKVKWTAHTFFQIYTFVDSDFNTLIENRNNFQFAQDVCPKSSGKPTCLKPREISIMVITL
jgi:hypothetical protein